MLLVGCLEGRSACKSSATTTPKILLFGTSLTWCNLTWSTSNSGKNGLVKQKSSGCVLLLLGCNLKKHTMVLKIFIESLNCFKEILTNKISVEQ